MKSLPALDSRTVTLGRIWLFLFGYAVFVAWLLQWVLLPHLLTGLHAGDGLLVGGDWIGFHAIATELAAKIHAQGWSSWELRPGNQAPSGIAAALYVLTSPHPWVLVPLNAAIHATTGVVLIRIMQFFVADLRHALVCVLPFMLFPSAMTWYAQIHKDGYYYAGIFMSLYGWLLLANLGTWKGRIGQPLLALLLIFSGCFLIWVVRPYGVNLIQGIGAIFALMLIPLFVLRGWRQQLSLPQAVVSILIILALPSVLGLYKDVGIYESRGVYEGVDHLKAEAIHRRDIYDQSNSVCDDAKTYRILRDSKIDFVCWQQTKWLPALLDNTFFTLATVRAGYAQSKGASNIDTDVHFNSALDFIPYLPRALQIGFAAPFPTHWFDQGSSEANTLMRRISAMEMIGVYCTLLLLPYALWLWRKKIEIWMTLSFCTILLLVYTYITPNVGSLYRTRYGFLMMLVALGIAGGISAWRRFFRHNSA